MTVWATTLTTLTAMGTASPATVSHGLRFNRRDAVSLGFSGSLLGAYDEQPCISRIRKRMATRRGRPGTSDPTRVDGIDAAARQTAAGERRLPAT